jgi:hypothetical protein
MPVKLCPSEIGPTRPPVPRRFSLNLVVAPSRQREPTATRLKIDANASFFGIRGEQRVATLWFQAADLDTFIAEGREFGMQLVGGIWQTETVA